MKYLNELNELECFTYEEALKILKNENSTNSMLQYYKNKNNIIQIRKGLYSTINPLDKEPLANKYLIGSKISDSAVISHFSALEYYGYFNQVTYRVFVSSESKFRTFEFNGFEYQRLPLTIKTGIITLPNGIRITDLERSVIDTINDFNNLLGFEELINCISLIPILDEDKLLKYLKEYNKKILYQKVGFILEHFNEDLELSDQFFNICLENYGCSSRYLLNENYKDNLITDSKWRLTYPENLWNKFEEVDLDVEI